MAALVPTYLTAIKSAGEVGTFQLATSITKVVSPCLAFIGGHFCLASATARIRILVKRCSLLPACWVSSWSSLKSTTRRGRDAAIQKCRLRAAANRSVACQQSRFCNANSFRNLYINSIHGRGISQRPLTHATFYTV